ncbi:MAG: UvrD-helicase domain-containing protein [Clostridia bacterium]|nr:UvrD-helicase domain-containing protein [Clostridia bacterium]
MNDMQFEAVVNVNGPLLVLAGAGSGKTTVLVNRIAYLIKYGNAYLKDFEPYLDETDIAEICDFIDGVTDTAPNIPALKIGAPNPWNILAITFTNKAANELKERLQAKITNGGDQINAGTFHSICGKILRIDGDRLGYTSNYTIYDTNDTIRVIKDCQKRLNIDDKILSHKIIKNEISKAKDSLISPEEFKETVGYDFRQKQIAEVYSLYQKTLQQNDAMDFDDMIANTVKLFTENPDVLEKYQERYKYIVVDEYQDTNHAQYRLVKLLSKRYENICVVGDDDQSIYKFRGATIENILDFENQYKSVKTIRLEQNYRSTNNILTAANSVIANNKGRKGKNLWSDKGEGEKIIAHTSNSENDEAKFIAETILQNVSDGMKFSDHAILYRMNAQSSTIENVFSRSGIAYVVYGGLKFYDRKEIKDVLSYLQFIANPSDDLRLKRIINEPKRGIGETTVNNAQEIAEIHGLSLFEVFKNAKSYEKLSRASEKLKEFCEKLEPLIKKADKTPPSEILAEMLEVSGYLAALKAQGAESQDRVENVNELATAIAHYEQETENPTLNEYLQEVALITDIDNLDETQDKVVMMTLHSAKGLEFPVVFLVGMEEGIFPGTRVMFAPPEEIEEERRLAYVGITRAKKKLFITNARRRMLFGNISANNVSRFVNEIDNSCVEFESEPNPYISSASFKPSQSAFSYDNKPFGRTSFGTSAKTNAFGNSSYAKQKPKSKFAVGDRVSHKVFGSGMIVKATPMGNDTMLEISFDAVGTKKVMANFAKIEKI